MALMKCKECGGPVSSEAKSCPKCGAKPPKRTSWPAVVFACLVGFVVLRSLFTDRAPATPTAPSNSPNAATALVATEPNKPSTPPPAIVTPNSVEAWEYSRENDPMSGKPAAYAKLLSQNSLSLDFSYRGRNHGQLMVRQHPKWGLDVLLEVEQGQMLCRSYNDSCKVTIRFDDGPPQRFGGAEPEDNSSTVIFLRDEARFLKEASKAKRILVQATFYKNGEQLLEFKTDKPLAWPPKL